jgi:heme exporter protein A
MYSIPKALQRIEDLLHKVDLWDRRYERVRTFSRGMQQRLSLARAILHDPDILLLDEPFTGLDITAIDNLTAILDSSVRHGRTVIFTTHDIHYALGNAKRALILQKGVLVEDKKTHQLSLDKMDTLLGVQPRLNTKELY